MFVGSPNGEQVLVREAQLIQHAVGLYQLSAVRRVISSIDLRFGLRCLAVHTVNTDATEALTNSYDCDGHSNFLPSITSKLKPCPSC